DRARGERRERRRGAPVARGHGHRDRVEARRSGHHDPRRVGRPRRRRTGRDHRHRRGTGAGADHEGARALVRHACRRGERRDRALRGATARRQGWPRRRSNNSPRSSRCRRARSSSSSPPRASRRSEPATT
ncbi:MAG: hypothetical protein AMXMBFR42_20040, partial [Burkholderiales bacterium]